MADVNLDRVGWQDGTLVSKAKVEVNGIIYDVEPEQYSGQTPLSSSNLKKMEDNTEKAINEVNTNLNNKINDLSKFSTSEIKTGKVWIDGKPIYRKVVSYTNKEISNGTTIAHNISNIDTVVDYAGKLYEDGQTLKMPFLYPGTNSKLYMRCNRTLIAFLSDGSLSLSAKSTRTYAFTLEYTKTTD